MRNKNTCVISERETRYTLDAISSLGFNIAIDIAYQKAVSIVDSDHSSNVASLWLSWSKNLLADARRYQSSKVLSEECMQLSIFYRKLAHKIYWYQRRLEYIGKIEDFIQEV